MPLLSVTVRNLVFSQVSTAVSMPKRAIMTTLGMKVTLILHYRKRKIVESCLNECGGYRVVWGSVY